MTKPAGPSDFAAFIAKIVLLIGMLPRICFDCYGKVLKARYRAEKEIPLDGDSSRHIAYENGGLVFGGGYEYTDIRCH